MAPTRRAATAASRRNAQTTINAQAIQPVLRHEELSLSLQQLKQLFRENEITFAPNAKLDKIHSILASRSLDERFRMIPTTAPAPASVHSEATAPASMHTGLTARVARALDMSVDDVTPRNLGAELNLDLSSIGSDDIQIIGETKSLGTPFFKTHAFKSSNDTSRFDTLRSLPAKAILQYSMFTSSSQKLESSESIYVESHLHIQQIISWESINLNNFLNKMHDHERIEGGELFTWERAFESFVFFVSKIYPGKTNMLQSYKTEMRNL
jgi:hypothetical protein